MSFRNNNVAGTGNRCRNNVGGESGRRRCECVFECLLELLEEAGENNNHHCCHQNSVSPGGGTENLRRRCDCECVFECLIELLEDALEEDPCRHHR